MLTLIVLLIVGSILAYLSQANLTPVSVFIGPYVFSGIPLFYLVVGSAIIGLVLSYLIYLVHVISTSWTLSGKNATIRKGDDTVLELTKRVHQLELENEKLKSNAAFEPEDQDAL